MHSSDISAEIRQYFSSTLRMPIQQIGTDVHVLELGFDSIMLIEAQRWLKTRFDCLIEVHQFFDELNTIDKIAGFVAASRPLIAATSDGLALPRAKEAISADHDLLQAAQQAGPLGGVGLMRSQLALLGDVIAEQNRVLMAMRNGRTAADER